MMTFPPAVRCLLKSVPPERSHREGVFQFRRMGVARGFSLSELVVALLLLSIIFVLGFSGIQQASQRAQRLDSVMRLRDQGQMILQYAADHRQTLPGPLKFTQHAWLNGQSGNQLSYRLLPYIPGGEKLRRGDLVPALGHRRFFAQCDPFVHVAYVPNLSRLGPADTHAWGYSSRNTPPQRIDYVPEAFRVVAIMEADRELQASGGNRVIDEGYASKRLFDDGRAALFFDWHVEVVPLSYRLGAEPYR